MWQVAPFWHPKSVPENLKEKGCSSRNRQELHFDPRIYIPGALVDVTVAVWSLPVVRTTAEVAGVGADALGPVAARVGGAGVL